MFTEIFCFPCNFMPIHFVIKVSNKFKGKLMKHLSKLMACLFMLLLLSSCSYVGNMVGKRHSADIVQKKLTLGTFNSVCNHSEWDVSFVQADSTYILLRGDADIVDDITVELDGTTLNITRKNKFGFSENDGDVQIIVSSPDLQFVGVSGTGDFVCGGVVYAEKLDVDLSGTGDADFSDIECNAMTVNLSGTGDFDAKRIKTLSFDVRLGGTGDIAAALQETDNSSFQSFGTGDMEINFKDCGKVSCDLSGTGDVKLSGNVSQLLKSVSGTGKFETKNLEVR